MFLSGLLMRRRWGWSGSVAVAVASLWYVPVGTVLAIVYLVLLMIGKRRHAPA